MTETCAVATRCTEYSPNIFFFALFPSSFLCSLLFLSVSFCLSLYSSFPLVTALRHFICLLSGLFWVSSTCSLRRMFMCVFACLGPSVQNFFIQTLCSSRSLLSLHAGDFCLFMFRLSFVRAFVCF